MPGSGSGGGGGGGGGVVGGAAPSSRGKATLAKAGAYDPSGDLFGQALAILGGAADTPGTPGSGGGRVSQAGLRAAIQQAGNQAEANRSSVYSQINQNILGRNPGIQSGYQQASATLQADARNRALSAQQAQDQRNAQIQAGAAALGLNVVPDPSSSRAQQTLNAQQANAQAQADAWSGFNGAAAQTAVERNNGVANAFSWEGTQQQAALQSALLSALAGAGDYWVTGHGGSKGSSLSPQQQLAGYENLLGYTNKDANTSIAAAKLAPKVTQKTVTPTGSNTYSYFAG